MKKYGFKNLFTLLVIILVSSCVAEKEGQNPKCETGTAFNKLSQTCVAFGKAPTSTLNVVNLTEDQDAVLFELKYTDDNNDQAVMCEVFDNESDIEIRSPLFSSVPSDVSGIMNQLNLCATGIDPITSPAQSATALALYATAQNARNGILSTDSTTGMLAALDTFNTSVRTLANYCKSVTNVPIVVFYGDSANKSMDELLVKKSWVEKRCYCVGGECSAEVEALDNKYGSYAISYNISDTPDGTSVTKQVTVNVSAVNDKPVAQDYHFSGAESTSTSLLPVAFTIPIGRDVESDGSFSLTYSLVNAPDNGTITSCALANDGSLSTDRTCFYIPTDNDANVASPLTDKLASISLPSTNLSNNLVLTANAAGLVGEGISVIIESAELLNTANNIDISVDSVGKVITIYVEDDVTEIDSVVSAVNSHYMASSLVTATKTGVANDTVTTIPSAVSLAGSSVPFDSFTYRVSDGEDISESVGTITVDIESQDDPPTSVTTPSASLVFTEDTPQTVRLSITDSESDTATSCTVTSLSSNLLVSGACTCPVGEMYCDVEFTPAENFNGAALFTWSISNNGIAGLQSTVARTEVISVSAVNDAPFAKNISIDLGTESDTATAESYSFNLSDSGAALGLDIDGNPLSYELTSALGGATLTGCVSGTILLPGATCVYTPVDGNVNGVATKATATYTVGVGNLVYEATQAGQNLNSLDLIIQDSSLSDTIDVFVDVVSSSATDVDIIVNVDLTNSTLSEIQAAIAADEYASNLITLTSSANVATVATAQTVTFAGASSSVDVLEFKATDTSGATAFGSIHLNLIEKDDSPVICPYSDFVDAPECGLAGCIGNTTPISNITPKSAGVLYYDKNSAVCYRSNGISSSNNWEIVTDYTSIIEKKIVNQNGSFEIDNIRIDEGGADTTEDADTITITNITIADGGLGLIPRKAANIQVFYDNSSVALAPAVPGIGVPMTGSLADGGASSDDLALKVKIIPSDGVVGTAVVTITFSDGTNNVDLAIPVEITDVAIQHKGWANIIAMGPKVDKNGNVKDASYVCNYSETKCNDGESCSGVSTPVGNIVADDVNAIYYEQPSASNPDGQCYYATATGSASWVAFNSYCNMTASYYEPNCTGATCLDSAAPAIQPENLNSFFTDLQYDSVNNIAQTTCYRSIGRAHSAGSSVLSTDQITSAWQEYKGTGSVELRWNPMVLSGSGTISGYNIFRRLPLESFDYKRPINKNLVATYTNQYIDNSSNSNFGPVPNTVYFYEVVPVVSTGTPAENVQIRSSDFEKIVLRVLVPGQNKVLVPRDIVNITQCDKLLDSSGSGSNYEYDSSLNTFTCPYEGPGDTGSVTGSTIYDFGRDLIVDRFEAGCPYTKSNENIESCPTGLANVATSGSCIGTVDPSVADGGGPITFSTAADQVYYNRDSGKCFQYSGGAWAEFDSLSLARLATIADRYDNAELPPIVHTTQGTSNNFCAQTATKATLGVCVVGGSFSINDNRCMEAHVDGNFENYNNIAGRLPSRKEQVAYSDWDLTQISDSIASTREGGLSLNSNSKCNTSSANGLESFYTDSVTPISNTLYTLPGTLSSAIRSLMTGSSQTELCSSKYGVQDSIGNVTEWSSDRLYCNLNSCTSLVSGDLHYIGNGDDDLQPADGNNPNFLFYGFNGDTGPCIDVNDDDTCDGNLTSWIFDQKSNGASRFFTPMGLPAVTDYISDHGGDFVSNFFEQIGISSGITSTRLHDDTIVVNQSLTDVSVNGNNVNGNGGLVSGGGYLSSNGAGTYHLEMVPVDDTNNNSRVDLGFRCVFPVSSSTYIE